MIKVTYTVIAILTMGAAHAQTGIERVLADVERNNKSLSAEKQYWETQKLSYKTGLNPENPKVEYDHLPGRPESAGTQQDFSVTQGLDFPTSYKKRRVISREQIIKADLQIEIFRQEILLEAKLACIDFIYRRELGNELHKRLQKANILLEATNRKTDQGESNILELNKIKLLRLEIKNQVELNETSISTIQYQLDELNGGIPLDLSQIEYPAISDIPLFEPLDSVIEAHDPEVKSMKQEREVAKEQIELTRSMTLPKLEGGYHQQSILGQKYQGFHIGVTIPLWENQNRLKTEKARLVHSEYEITEHRTKHYYKNKQLYDQYLHWHRTFNDYENVLTTANNEELLSKALQAGQLSLIEYLMEIRYFYDANDKSKAAEREYHRIIAELYQFML